MYQKEKYTTNNRSIARCSKQTIYTFGIFPHVHVSVTSCFIGVFYDSIKKRYSAIHLNESIYIYILTIGWDVLHIKKHGGDLNPEEKDFGTGGRMPRRIHAAPAW